MSLSATPKTGFLVEDGSKLGVVIAYLNDYARYMRTSHPRELAQWLNDIQATTYYQPIQQQLIEQIEVVEVSK